MSKKRPCQLLKYPSHKDIVGEFVAHHREVLANELGWFSDAQSINDAIKKAAESLVPRSPEKSKQPNTKRHSHQRRLVRGVIDDAVTTLRDKRFRRRMPFTQIFGIVTESIAAIPGAGPLYIYDVALRIGAYLKSYPDEVYLHAGALKGAKRLFPGRRLNRTISQDSFPTEYGGLAPYEIENLLCIYHECIPASRKGNTKT